MISKSNVKLCSRGRWFVVIFFKTSNRTMIRFGFCNARNNQGRGKWFLWLIFPDIRKTESNNCSKFYLPSDVMIGQMKIPYTIILSQYDVFPKTFRLTNFRRINCLTVTVLCFCQKGQRTSVTAILISQYVMCDPIHAEKTSKQTLLRFGAN